MLCKKLSREANSKYWSSLWRLKPS